ncbi:MAG: InlB B-repeat-containing protein, partial [Coriobacteriaceae bacterium]|nr:InlB B-repeat-containing protein [Coriobacteriaceae bacterium]
SDGGAIYVSDYQSLVITGNISFSGNTAASLVVPAAYPVGFDSSQLTGAVTSISPPFALVPGTDLGMLAFNNYDIAPAGSPGYTVRYEPGEHGAFAAQVSANLARDAATPAFFGTPTAQPGWEFADWAPAVELTVTQSRVYTAQWRAIDYSLTFDANGADSGAVPAGGTVHHIGDAIALPGNAGGLVRSGHSFSGWSLTPGGEAVEAIIFAAGDMTVYAVWVPLTSAAAGATPATGEAPGVAVPIAATLAAASAASLVSTAALRHRRHRKLAASVGRPSATGR